MSASPSDLSERIAALVAPPAGPPSPEDDAGRGEAIGRDLGCLPSMSDEAKSSLLDGLAHDLCTRFAGAPAHWNPLVHRTAIYVDRHLGNGGGTGALPLSSRLLRELLLAYPEMREAFFAAIDGWPVILALEKVLAEIPLSTCEVLTLARRIDLCTQNDVARALPMSALGRWAASHPDTARNAIDCWLEGDQRARDLPIAAAERLAVGAIRAATPDSRSWREKVLDALVASGDEVRWALAAILACSAWPDPEPPVEQRHEALLQHVRRAPRWLVSFGLRALRQDAHPHPAESVQVAVRLMEMLDAHARDQRAEIGQGQGQGALLAAEVGRRALESPACTPATVAAAARLLPHLVEVPVSASMYLDWFLDALVSHDPVAARELAESWLAKHAASLQAEPRGFESRLPCLTRKLGPTEVGRWLVGFMTSDDVGLRILGARILAATDRAEVTSDTLLSLSALEAEAVAHQLAGAGIAGEVYVPLLLKLVAAREDTRAAALEIAVRDAAVDYPTIVRRVLDDSWSNLPDAQQAALQGARGALVAVLEETERDLDRRQAVPELHVTSPARRPWYTIQTQLFQTRAEAVRRSGRFRFLMFATRVPVGRGEAMVANRAGGAPVRFRTLSGEVAMALRDNIDPLGARVARLEHRRRAAEILERAKQPR